MSGAPDATTAQRIVLMRAQGFVCVEGFLAPDQRRALSTDYERLLRDETSVVDRVKSGNGTQVRAISGRLRGHGYGGLEGLLDDARLVALLRGYLVSFHGQGVPPVIAAHAQLEIESNDRPGVTNNSVWHFDRVPSLKCAVFLDAADRDSGAMEVVPGSHARTRQLALAQLEREANPLWIDNYAEGIDEEDAVTLAVPAGSVVVFDTFCLHRGGRIAGAGRRRTIRTVTWPLALDRRYLRLALPEGPGLAGARWFHPYARTEATTRNPVLRFDATVA